MPYLFTTIRRLSIDLGRRDDRRRRREDYVGGEVDTEQKEAFHPWFESESSDDETRALLEAGLKELPPKFAEVVVMKVWGERTFAEIGDALEISPNTAASRYRYGFEALKKKLTSARRKGVGRALMEEAVESGFEAVVLTADAPPSGNRERDLRSGFRLPEDLGVPSLVAAMGERKFTIGETFDLMTRALTWPDLGDLASEVAVPVIVKGVLTAEDATLAVEHGAGAIVVSNHGGRQLDRSLATGDALAEIVDAVEGRIPVLVDGGIRRGIDVAIALALGADAVLVGRPALWGLAAAGRSGALRVLEMLREELELALALCGCTSPAGLTRAHVRKAPATSVYSEQ